MLSQSAVRNEASMTILSISRRAFGVGLATSTLTGARADAKPTQQVGDVIDIYDENTPDFKVAYRLGARAVLHETNYFVRKDGISAEYKKRKAAIKAMTDMPMLWGAFMMMTDEPTDVQFNRLTAVEDFSDRQTLLSLDWGGPGHGKKRASYKQLREFAELIHKSKGFYPLVYGSNFVTDCPEFKAGDTFFANCPLWIAAPGASAPKFPTKTWSKYTLWQYQFDDVRVSKADWSRFNASFEEMKKAWPLNGI